MAAPIVDPVASIMALAFRLAGIRLDEGKRVLVESRLGKRLRQLGLSMADYALMVESNADEQVILIDQLTTNHTAWFREADHFADFEKRVLPAIKARQAGVQRPRLRMWCAAAATGEEPWTIALCLARTLTLANWDAALLATDISTKALDKARAGRYGEARVESLTPADRQLALTVAEPGPPRVYAVAEALRKVVTFARLNLMEDWPMRGPFDVIFCRNVMIYFDRPTQERLVNRMAALLAPGGTLYVGHAESLSSIRHPLRTLGPATYAA